MSLKFVTYLKCPEIDKGTQPLHSNQFHKLRSETLMNKVLRKFKQQYTVIQNRTLSSSKLK